MKKRVLITVYVLLFALLLSVPISVTADGGDEHECYDTCHCHDIDIEFDSDVCPEVKERVSKSLLAFASGEKKPADYNGDGASECIALGHDLRAGTTSITIHGYYTAAPRCRKETYDYEICLTCGYEKYTFLYYMRLNCCP